MTPGRALPSWVRLPGHVGGCAEGQTEPLWGYSSLPVLHLLCFIPRNFIYKTVQCLEHYLTNINTWEITFSEVSCALKSYYLPTWRGLTEGKVYKWILAVDLDSLLTRTGPTHHKGFKWIPHVRGLP